MQPFQYPMIRQQKRKIVKKHAVCVNSINSTSSSAKETIVTKTPCVFPALAYEFIHPLDISSIA